MKAKCESCALSLGAVRMMLSGCGKSDIVRLVLGMV